MQSSNYSGKKKIKIRKKEITNARRLQLSCKISNGNCHLAPLRSDQRPKAKRDSRSIPPRIRSPTSALTSWREAHLCTCISKRAIRIPSPLSSSHSRRFERPFIATHHLPLLREGCLPSKRRESNAFHSSVSFQFLSARDWKSHRSLGSPSTSPSRAPRCAKGSRLPGAEGRRRPPPRGTSTGCRA